MTRRGQFRMSLDTGIRSTSAASGSIRATATPGSASPRRPASRSTEAIRRGGRRIPASPGTRTRRRRPGRRSAIRLNGWPIIEAFLGGDGARILEEEGPAAGFAYVSAQLVALFGSDVSAAIRPLAATSWSRMEAIGGAYSCALPGRSDARARLARPIEDCLFFAGEATHPFDFTTAHGAHDSGQRAANEAMVALADRHRLGRRHKLAAAGA